MVTRRDYNKELVEAAFSVLIEIYSVLGEYRDGLAVIGGWVPELLLPANKEKHVGSIDVDIALNHTILQEPGYETIRNRLISKGYAPDKEQPYIFYRTVQISGREQTIKVDLLSGEYGGAGKGHRTQRIQDVRARKARGCDLAFDLFEERTITGLRPDGARDSVRVRISSIVAFLAMKGMVIVKRDKEKDAYDIYYCLTHFPGGLDALVKVFRAHIGQRLVREGLLNIAAKFESPEHVGPVAVANFNEITDPDERARIQRDVYEKVNYLLRQLGLVSPRDE